MEKDAYVLGHARDVFERERLGLIERHTDEFSHRHLSALGIQRGWCCLEVGAGHGSLIRWLADQVGAQGRVVATDINPRFLTTIDLPNVEVWRHDIRTDPLEPNTYDLVHCRAVLMHLAEPHLVIRRMVETARIGGWVLIEEADYSSFRAVDSGHAFAEVFNRKTREISERVVRSSAANLYFGCRVRGLLEDAGLTEIGNEGRTVIVRGGEPEAGRQCMTFQAFMERGFMSETEYAELQMVYSDPSFSYIGPTLFAAWGKRIS